MNSLHDKGMYLPPELHAKFRLAFPEQLQDSHGVCSIIPVEHLCDVPATAHNANRAMKLLDVVRTHRTTDVARWPKCYLVCTKRPFLEAFALMLHGDYCVVLSAGLLLCLRRHFWKVLSLEATFPDVGIPSGEQSTRVVPSELGSACIYPLDVAAAMPICQSRKQFADLLASLAFDWVVLHELSHIRAGHLLLGPSQSAGMRQETCGPEAVSSSLVDQATELEADTWAAVLALENVLNAFDSGSENGKLWHRFANCHADAISIWLYAVHGLNRLLWAGSDRPSDSDVGSHPHPITRQIALAQAADAILRAYTKDIQASMLDRWGLIVQETEFAFAQLYSGESIHSNLTREEFVFAEDRIRVLGEEIKRLRERLDEVAFHRRDPQPKQ